MDRAGLEEGALESNMLGRVIESVQERVEGYNFDIRKHVLEYDNVVNKQREVIYAERRKILSRDDLHDDLLEMFEAEVHRVVNGHAAQEELDAEAVLAELRRFAPIPSEFGVAELEAMSPDELVAQCVTWADETYWMMNKRMGEAMYRAMRQEDVTVGALFETEDAFYKELGERLERSVGRAVFEPSYDLPVRRLPQELETRIREAVVEVQRLFRDRRLMLRQIDDHWVRHLTSLDMLREGIGLRAVGQQNPLVAYQKEAFEMYQEMLGSVQSQIVRTLFLVPKAAVVSGQPRAADDLVRRPRERQLTFRTSGGSQAADTAPQPHRAADKPGRNDPCWCGSGKKYKDCHWRSDRRAAASATGAGRAKSRSR
ncbi:MAG: SEC-C metal-binding domain-containing protein [Anaerolineae bacterium]